MQSVLLGRPILLLIVVASCQSLTLLPGGVITKCTKLQQ